MPVRFADHPLEGALPVHVRAAGAPLPDEAAAWATATGFTAEAGKVLVYPGADGKPAGAVLGLGSENGGHAPLMAGALARTLPAGAWRFAEAPAAPHLAALGVALGAYVFARYGRKPGRDLVFERPAGVDAAALDRAIAAHALVRDLVNTPTGDMGPGALEAVAREIAAAHGARVTVTAGDDLLSGRFAMIHAVGRAGSEAPRLVDIVWGDETAPLLTLVGKGVCFDTGGLDIKPSSGMLLMKKDMGGAAHALGLFALLAGAGVKARLRVLLPIVENAISGNAFRPGDVLTGRKGISVEVGNTDAEGRLILADALALADEEAPDLIVNLATLTGSARVALGPDLPPFYTDDDSLAAALAAASASEADPLWRLPLWRPYDNRYSSRIADLNNVNTDGFAGSIIAALFLRRFVERARAFVHFDLYAWNPVDRPHGGIGGEAQGLRALARVLADRYAH